MMSQSNWAIRVHVDEPVLREVAVVHPPWMVNVCKGMADAVHSERKWWGFSHVDRKNAGSW
jgi:hypothetical protein